MTPIGGPALNPVAQSVVFISPWVLLQFLGNQRSKPLYLLVQQRQNTVPCIALWLNLLGWFASLKICPSQSLYLFLFIPIVKPHFISPKTPCSMSKPSMWKSIVTLCDNNFLLVLSLFPLSDLMLSLPIYSPNLSQVLLIGIFWASWGFVPPPPTWGGGGVGDNLISEKR